jgi:hypothetical protein
MPLRTSAIDELVSEYYDHSCRKLIRDCVYEQNAAQLEILPLM